MINFGASVAVSLARTTLSRQTWRLIWDLKDPDMAPVFSFVISLLIPMSCCSDAITTLGFYVLLPLVPMVHYSPSPYRHCWFTNSSNQPPCYVHSSAITSRSHYWKRYRDPLMELLDFSEPASFRSGISSPLARSVLFKRKFHSAGTVYVSRRIPCASKTDFRPSINLCAFRRISTFILFLKPHPTQWESWINLLYAIAS